MIIDVTKYGYNHKVRKHVLWAMHEQMDQIQTMSLSVQSKVCLDVEMHLCGDQKHEKVQRYSRIEGRLNCSWSSFRILGLN